MPLGSNDMHETINPLVSIIVITYNSSKYVLETLESANSQTYQNIELIISDDCSTDNTVDVCRSWIEKNKVRFVSTEIVTIQANTGISANCNRGIKISKGEWIKTIAGDDVLYSNAIFEYVHFVQKNNYEICCSKLLLFGDDQTIVENTRKFFDKYYTLLLLPLKEQRKLIIKSLFIPGPGVFHSRKLYDLVDGYDERFPLGEEWPFYLKIIETGYPIPLLPIELVSYRISNISECRGHQFGLSKGVFDSTKNFFFRVRLKILLRNLMLLTTWHQALDYIYMSKKHEDKSKPVLFVFKFLLLFDPIYLWTKLKKYLWSNK